MILGCGGMEELLLTVECQGQKINTFCNHHSEDWIQQASSIDAKSRGRF